MREKLNTSNPIKSLVHLQFNGSIEERIKDGMWLHDSIMYHMREALKRTHVRNVSKAAGLHFNTVSHIKLGKTHSISLATFVLLAAVLMHPIDHYFQPTDKQKNEKKKSKVKKG